MPSTINGIGTWYWGKTNVHQINGQCPACNSSVTLKSYDTTLFFVVVFIPVIPLGKKRIVDQCPRCTKHRVIPLNKWNEIKAQAIGESSNAARADRNDPAKAIEAVQTALSFREQEQFIEVANEMAAMHPNAWLLHATIGDGYGDFGMDGDAQAAYEKALLLGDQPQVRKALAVLMLRNYNPQAAHQLLHDALDASAPVNAHFMTLLAQGYQTQGDHQQALAILDQLNIHFPAVAASKELIKIRKTSEKNLSTGKRVKSAQIKKIGAGTQVNSGGFLNKLPRLIPLALLLLIVGIYLGVAIKRGNARTAWLVNGQDVGESVSINGQRYILPPNGYKEIEVPEGDIKLAVHREGKPDIETTASIRTNFWSRPFKSHTVVLNPDRIAVIIREETVFAESHPQGEEDNYGLEVRSGQALYDFPGADYEFQPFPQSIKLDNKGSAIHKWKVDSAREYSAVEKAQLISEYASPDDKLQYGEHKRMLKN